MATTNGASTNSSKKIRILLINPNATPSMTANCITMVQPTLPADVEVIPFTAPHPAPTAIEGQVDNILSAAAAFRALVPLQQQEHYDAFLVACYSDHALIKMLREEFEAPCIGIMEASLLYAKTLGSRVGIVATSKRSALAQPASAQSYGVTLAGSRACELGVLELERLPREKVLQRMKDTAVALVEQDRADVLTLGCAGMTDMKAAVEQAVGPDVQVVDGVVAGVHHLVGIVRMGGKTAKKGVWKSAASGREARGQDYL